MTNFRIQLLATVLTLVVVGSSTAAAGGARSRTPPLSSGRLDTALAYTAADSADEDLALTRVRQAGASAMRLTLYWSDVAPSGKPAGFDASNPDSPGYDWSAFDAQVEQVVQHGLTPQVAIFRAPRWARIGHVPNPSGAPMPTELAKFATAAARRYSGTSGVPRVRTWIVWLEPNTDAFTPQYSGGKLVSPGLYRADVNAVADAVHAVDPSNIVVAGGLSPFTIKTTRLRIPGPLHFMRELLCMSTGPRPHPTCSGRAHFDVWGHNPYTSGGPTHHALNPDDVSLGDLGTMRALITAAQRAGHIVSKHRVAFWATEFSWDTNPPDPNALPVGLQARWTAEALHQMWKNGITLVTWLQLRDEALSNGPVQGGLYYRGKPTTADDATATVADDVAKPTLTAFRFPFVAYLSRATIDVWGRTPTSAAGVVRVQWRSGETGNWITVGRLHANRYGIFQGTIPVAATRQDSVRATVGSDASLPFSLTQPRDRFVNPFG